MEQQTELAACLRSWRDRLSPSAVGLPTQTRRRAPGLRREELAQLAGLSADYLTRLEQGRASNPSREVLAALARALRLSSDEQAHLFRVAGHAPPGPGRMSRHMTPSLQRIVERLDALPVLVIDRAWEIVSWNGLGAALIGDPSAWSGRERNIVWRRFAGLPGRVVGESEEGDLLEGEMVADLHDAVGRYPEDPELQELIEDLRATSARFDELWRARPTAVHAATRKTFEHPDVGRVTLDCDVLTVHGSDLRLVIYTAEPESPDAAALELVGVLGLQAM
jgi:transcriptional regulator with XRE-family HTH domain